MSGILTLRASPYLSRHLSVIAGLDPAIFKPLIQIGISLCSTASDRGAEDPRVKPEDDGENHVRPAADECEVIEIKGLTPSQEDCIAVIALLTGQSGKGHIPIMKALSSANSLGSETA